jgi:hypothetical protein
MLSKIGYVCSAAASKKSDNGAPKKKPTITKEKDKKKKDMGKTGGVPNVCDTAGVREEDGLRALIRRSFPEDEDGEYTLGTVNRLKDDEDDDENEDDDVTGRMQSSNGNKKMKSTIKIKLKKQPITITDLIFLFFLIRLETPEKTNEPMVEAKMLAKAK